MDARLLDALYAVAHAVPIALVESLAQALQTVTPGAWHDIATTAGARVANPSYRRQVVALIHTWQTVAAHEPPGSIAAALQAAAYAVERERHAQRIALVWTGPTSGRPFTPNRPRCSRNSSMKLSANCSSSPMPSTTSPKSATH
ncbi:MAG: hypothetical protein HC828_07405, partial [Blastochloris sp.]|nr:hypothetical protein [Blastochloris sp.]